MKGMIEITAKDLDYVKDAYNWNNIALCKYQEYLTLTNNKDIITLLNDLIKMHSDNTNKLLNMLKEYTNEG